MKNMKTQRCVSGCSNCGLGAPNLLNGIVSLKKKHCHEKKKKEKNPILHLESVFLLYSYSIRTFYYLNTFTVYRCSMFETEQNKFGFSKL